MMKLINRIALTIGATTLAGSALAHHSGHFFVDETVTLTGTVTKVSTPSTSRMINSIGPGIAARKPRF